LTGNRENLGSSHTNTLACMNNLAVLLRTQKKYPEAEILARECLRSMSITQGDHHENVIGARNNLASILASQGGSGSSKLSEAEALYRTALKARSGKLGNHPNTLASKKGLSGILKKQGRIAEADALLQDLP
jgi:hypothetical protein